MAHAQSDEELAGTLRHTISVANEIAADLIRRGISVQYDVHELRQIGKPDGDCLEVRIRREI